MKKWQGTLPLKKNKLKRTYFDYVLRKINPFLNPLLIFYTENGITRLNNKMALA